MDCFIQLLGLWEHNCVAQFTQSLLDSYGNSRESHVYISFFSNRSNKKYTKNYWIEPNNQTFVSNLRQKQSISWEVRKILLFRALPRFWVSKCWKGSTNTHFKKHWSALVALHRSEMLGWSLGAHYSERSSSCVSNGLWRLHRWQCLVSTFLKEPMLKQKKWNSFA